jgi:hypothetical protein
MKEEILLKALKKQTKEQLISLLLESYEELNRPKRNRIFGPICEKVKTPKFNAQKIYDEIHKFYEDSIAGEYYAPFDINSKNFSDIPEETELWCDLIAKHFSNSLELFNREEYKMATECFDKLYYLQENMCEEIVFADELGPWMIPIKQATFIPKYIESIAKTKTAEGFKNGIKMLMDIDDYDYKKTKVFNKAMRVGTKEQKNAIIQMKPKERRR